MIIKLRSTLLLLLLFSLLMTFVICWLTGCEPWFCGGWVMFQVVGKLCVFLAFHPHNLYRSNAMSPSDPVFEISPRFLLLSHCISNLKSYYFCNLIPIFCYVSVIYYNNNDDLNLLCRLYLAIILEKQLQLNKIILTFYLRYCIILPKISYLP